jgi:uncharacterized membrane protein YeaQ/YmgE (transglycosylase-associated protein family)
MSLLVWAFFGLTAGFVASKIVDRTGRDVVLDFVLGIAKS